MHGEHREELDAADAIGTSILGAALKVHRAFGPGLLENAYEAFLAHELGKIGHKVDRQVALPVVLDDLKIDIGCRIDLLVDDLVIVEVKAVEQLAAVHEAQLLTYLRLSSRRLGYLINFNVPTLQQGIRRKVL